jgi:hypothetical protein
MSRSLKLAALSPSGPPSLGPLSPIQSTTKSPAHLRGLSDSRTAKSYQSAVDKPADSSLVAFIYYLFLQTTNQIPSP